MILPTKRVGEDRALITLAADVLDWLDEATTVSRLWEKVQLSRSDSSARSLVTYDWFVLALDLLYILGAVDLVRGRLIKVSW